MLNRILAMFAIAVILTGFVGMLVLLFDAARFAFRQHFATRTTTPPRRHARPVECHPAWVWTCDHCGRDSFSRSMVPELTPEELHEAAVKLGIIEEWQSVDDLPPVMFYTRPLHVTCKYCGTHFSTVVR